MIILKNIMNYIPKTNRKKPQGKLNEDVIFEGIIQGKKLKQIAVEAGSLAKGEDNKTGAVIQKVKSSKKLQTRLEKYFNDNLEKANEIQKRLFDRILEKKDINKLSPNEAMTQINKTGNLIYNLTKQSDNLSSKTPTNIQINIVSPK